MGGELGSVTTHGGSGNVWTRPLTLGLEVEGSLNVNLKVVQEASMPTVRMHGWRWMQGAWGTHKASRCSESSSEQKTATAITMDSRIEQNKNKVSKKTGGGG